jgi:hypothetical protein
MSKLLFVRFVKRAIIPGKNIEGKWEPGMIKNPIKRQGSPM